MKLLLTNDELHEVNGGTQLFIGELARELLNRGHEIAVYTWLAGSLADQMRANGVRVVQSPKDCGFTPDLIHGQQHLSTMAALAAFPGVPVLYHCHGYSPWQEQPPVHPRIVRYVSMSLSLVPWIAETVGRKKEEILVILNSVNLARFQHVRTPRTTPQRALLFGNSPLPGELLSRLRQACHHCGLVLDFAGKPFDNPIASPEEVLPTYDIVFAAGRSALEALASGCAVIPCTAHGCSAMVMPDEVARWRAMNFISPKRNLLPSIQSISKIIRSYHPTAAAAVTENIREICDFRLTCNLLETSYQKSLADWNASPCSADAEATAFSHYLSTLGPYVKGAGERFAALRETMLENKARLVSLKQQNEALKLQWRTIERRLPKWLRRWIFRGRETA